MKQIRPPIYYTLIARAMRVAYFNARALGLSAEEATADAHACADFIREVMR